MGWRSMALGRVGESCLISDQESLVRASRGAPVKLRTDRSSCPIPAVEGIDEPRFSQLVNKTDIDKIVYFGLGSFRIKGHLDLQRVLKPFQRGINILDQKLPVSSIGSL